GSTAGSGTNHDRSRAALAAPSGCKGYDRPQSSWLPGEPNIMSALARLEPILESLSEDRIRQLIDFARFLALEQDRQEWLRFGQERLAQAYGQDEPDYSEADIRPNRNP